MKILYGWCVQIWGFSVVDSSLDFFTSSPAVVRSFFYLANASLLPLFRKIRNFQRFFWRPPKIFLLPIKNLHSSQATTRVAGDTENRTMALENTSFIHFNDIYNVEKAPRFVGSIKKAQTSLKEKHTFTFFSGDAFSPSSMSTILRGEQMIPVLNSLNIDAACLGMCA